MKPEASTRDSPFLKFMRAELAQHGTQHRRDLSDKTHVRRLVESKELGGTRLKLPQQLGVLDSPEQITAEVLGKRAALKFAHGWSAKGVMLLERIGEKQYFDHMALREWTLAEIRQRQQRVAHRFKKKTPEWIVEEFLTGAQPGSVPFDYKFYMFQGQIAMVAQIDRNSSPPRMVKLDGDLRPLTPGQDYRFKPKELQAGVPVVPRSAVMLSRWAIELSLMTASPFVRVDLYDTEQGPYFGEFTFASGAEVKRTITYSTELLATFDRLFAQAEQRLNGVPSAVKENWSTRLANTDADMLVAHPQIPLTEYQRYAYFLYNRGGLGGYRLAQSQERLLESGGDELVNDYLVQGHLAASREARITRRPPWPPLWETARKVYRKATTRQHHDDAG